MADIVTPDVRSRMMAGINSKNTKPEMIIRKGLHGLGLRFRLHDKRLPGKPDLVFPKFRAAIFVNGCFWHGHDCDLFKWPKSNTEFWRAKIDGNVERDDRNKGLLRQQSWRVLTVWECAVKNRSGDEVRDVIDRCADWLVSGDEEAKIPHHE